ncbi:MAG TPA: hypothetical protein VKT32_01070, partial [Chthonomonadaceae bacterium]|nr:hypothetical protein [Chthonomonadaceae bacterium]
SAPRIVTRDSVARSLPFGQAHWTGRLLVHINDLFTEPIRPGYELALRDAALEFGARLRRAPSGRAVGWTGPLRDKLYAPLQLTPEECYAWPEAAPVMSGLPGLIRDSLSAVNHAGRPDLILVGGIGAFWPFAAEAARSSGRVQQSESPEEDVARGAAWWPEVEAVWSDALFSVASAQSAPLPDWLADTSFAPEAASTDSEAGGFFFPVEELPAFAGFGQESLPVLEDTSFSTSGDVVTQTPTGADLFGLPAAETELYPSLLSSSESEKDTDVSLFASAQTPAQRPEYDILAPESTPVHAEEEDLDSLPPWDPRRNES